MTNYHTLYSKLFLGLGIALLTFALDQGVKWIMLEWVEMPLRPPIEVTPFFTLAMVWNKGISFGLLASHDQPYLLSALSAAIIIVLLVWLRQAASAFTAIALGLVIGGAAGNIADRLRFGAVADFFDFHIGIYHWPAFNIADSAIFIGVVLLCAQGMLKGSKS